MKKIFTLAIMALFSATATVAESPSKLHSRAKKIEAFNHANQANAQSDAPMWRPRTMTTYRFDNYSTNQYIIDSKYTITYDDSGRVLSYTRARMKDNTVVEENKHTAKYNDLGYVIEDVYSERGGETVSKYTYDSVDPSKITEIWEGYYIDGVLKYDPIGYKFEYIRDSQNRVVKINEYDIDYGSNNLTLDNTIELTYNENGEPITQTVTDGDGVYTEVYNIAWESFSGYFYGLDEYYGLDDYDIRRMLSWEYHKYFLSMNETQRLKQIDYSWYHNKDNSVIKTEKFEYNYTQNSVIQNSVEYTTSSLNEPLVITDTTEMICLGPNKFIVYHNGDGYTSVERFDLSTHGDPTDIYFPYPGNLLWDGYYYERFELSHIIAEATTNNFNAQSYKGIETLDPEHGYLLEFEKLRPNGQFMVEAPEDWTIFETIEPDITYSTAYEKYTFGDYINLNTSSDVDLPEIDNSNLPVEYFTIDGYKIENPENGFFIRRQGTDVKKILLR